MAETELVERAIDPQYLRFVVERLESFRSHPLGFRVAGTPEEWAAVSFVAEELRGLGLEVAEEPVPVMVALARFTSPETTAAADNSWWIMAVRGGQTPR